MTALASYDYPERRLDPFLLGLARHGLDDDLRLPLFGGLGPAYGSELPEHASGARVLPFDHPDGLGDELIALGRQGLGPDAAAFGGGLAFLGTGPGVVHESASCCDDCADKPGKSCGGGCGAESGDGASGSNLAPLAASIAARRGGDTRAEWFAPVFDRGGSLV